MGPTDVLAGDQGPEGPEGPGSAFLTWFSARGTKATEAICCQGMYPQRELVSRSCLPVFLSLGCNGASP